MSESITPSSGLPNIGDAVDVARQHQRSSLASKSDGLNSNSEDSAFTSVFGTSANTISQQLIRQSEEYSHADSHAASNSHLLRATLMQPRNYDNYGEPGQLQYAPQADHYQQHYATPFGQAIHYGAKYPQVSLPQEYESPNRKPFSPANPHMNNAVHSENFSSSRFSPATAAVAARGGSSGAVGSPGNIGIASPHAHYQHLRSPVAVSAGNGGVSSRTAAVNRLSGLIASGQNSSTAMLSTSRPDSRLSAAQSSPAGVHISNRDALAAPEVLNIASITPESHPILAELLTAPHSHSITSPSARYSRPPSSALQVDTPLNNKATGNQPQSPSSAFGVPPSQYVHASGYTPASSAANVSLPTFGDGLSMDLQLDQPHTGSNYYNSNQAGGSSAPHNFYQHPFDQNQQQRYVRPTALSPMQTSSSASRMPTNPGALSPLPPPPVGSNYGMAPPPFAMPPGAAAMPPPQIPPQQILIARMPLDALRQHQGNTRVMLLPSSMFLNGQFPPNTLLQMPRGELIQLISAPNMRPGPVQQFFRVLHVGPVVGPAAMSMPTPQSMPFNSAGAPLPPPPGAYRPFMPPVMPRPPANDDISTSASDALMSSSSAVDATAHFHQTTAGGFQPGGMAFMPPGMFPTSAAPVQRGLPPVSNLFQPGMNNNADAIRGAASERFAVEMGGPPPPGSVLMMPVRLPNGDIVMMPPPPLAANSFGQSLMMAAGGGQFVGFPSHQMMPGGGFMIPPPPNNTSLPSEDESVKSHSTPVKRRLSTPGATPPPALPPPSQLPSPSVAPTEPGISTQQQPKKRRSKKQQKKEEEALLAAVNSGVQQPASLAVEEQAKRKKYPRKPRSNKKPDVSDASFSSVSTCHNTAATCSSANTTLPVAPEEVEKPVVGFSPANSLLSMFRPRRPVGGAMPAAIVASYISRNKLVSSAVDEKLGRLQRSNNNSRSRSGSRRNSLQNSALLLPNGAVVAKPRSRNRSKHRLSGGEDVTDESSQSQSSSANNTLDMSYDDDDLAMYDDEDDLYDDDDLSDGEDGGDDEDGERGGSRRRRRGGKSGSRESSRRSSQSRNPSRHRRNGQFDDDSMLSSPFKKPHSPPHFSGTGGDADLTAYVVNSQQQHGGPRYSLASCDEQQAREIRRRLERKRREHIKGGYDRLKNAVPALTEEVRAPPQRVLEATLNYVTRLKQQERKLIVKKIEILQRKKEVEAKFRHALRGHFQRKNNTASRSVAENQPASLADGAASGSGTNALAFIGKHNAVPDMPSDDIFDMLVSNIYDAVRADMMSVQHSKTLSSSSSTASLSAAATAALIADAAAETSDKVTNHNTQYNSVKTEEQELNMEAHNHVDGEPPADEANAQPPVSNDALDVSDGVDASMPLAATGDSVGSQSNSLALCSVKNIVLIPKLDPYLPVIDVKTTSSCRSRQFRRFSTWKHVSENSVPQLLSAEAPLSTPAQIIQQTLAAKRPPSVGITNGFHSDDDEAQADDTEPDAEGPSHRNDNLPPVKPIVANGHAFLKRDKPASSSSTSWLSALWPVGMASQLEYDYAMEERRVCNGGLDLVTSKLAYTKPALKFDDAGAVFGAGAFSSALRYRHTNNVNAACTSMSSIARFLKKVALVEALVEANDFNASDTHDDAHRSVNNNTSSLENVEGLSNNVTNREETLSVGNDKKRRDVWIDQQKPHHRMVRGRSLSG